MRKIITALLLVASSITYGQYKNHNGLYQYSFANGTTATTQVSTDSSGKLQTTAGSRQLNAAIQTQLKAKADTGSTTIYVKGPIKIDTVSNPGHITITLDTANMPGLRPYKVYTALLSQTDTAGTAPTATVLENTTGYTFSYTYSGVGWYTVTASGSAFSAGHSYVLLQNQAYTPMSVFEYTTASTTAISLHVRKTDGTPINGSLSGEIEIRVYP